MVRSGRIQFLLVELVGDELSEWCLRALSSYARNLESTDSEDFNCLEPAFFRNRLESSPPEFRILSILNSLIGQSETVLRI